MPSHLALSHFLVTPHDVFSNKLEILCSSDDLFSQRKVLSYLSYAKESFDRQKSSVIIHSGLHLLAVY